MPKILKVDPANIDRSIIKEAADIIRRGGLVAFPTETVYGLGADARNDYAVKKIFEVKRRPPDNPLIVHVHSIDQAMEIADIPEEYLDVLTGLWPGPVTIVAKSRGRVSKLVTAGLDTVAVRVPGHPVALALIEESGVPIAAPSANRSGRPSPTTADHVIEDLGDEVDVVIDGGETIFGVESTVIDVTRKPPLLLRPGPVSVEDLEKMFGGLVVPDFARGSSSLDKPPSPGLKYRHYAPDTPIIIVRDPSLIEFVESLGLRVAIICGLSNCPRKSGITVLDLGPNEFLAAKHLFPTLRKLDHMNVDVALVIPMEERGIMLAVMNRLRKAARGFEARSCADLINALKEYGLIQGSISLPQGRGC